MANPITFIGRVESDPMRIPTAASMSRGEQEPFDRVLRDTVANDEPVQRVDPRNSEQPEVVDVDDATQDVDVDDVPRERAATDEDAPVGDDGDAPSEDASVEPDADVTESIRRGEPERQETAGKGSDSPRTSSQNSEQLIAATLQSSQPKNAAPIGVAQQAAAQTANAARGAEPAIRGAGTLESAGQAAPKAQRAAAGYGTRNAASAQLLEQARDSVFKQILMKLKDDGGEMRVRLQPPELGELDLRLTVEGGNRLSLAIGAERPDMVQLLQRHLEELKQTLQQNGMEITGAEVQTRSEFERGNGADGRQGGAASGGENDHAEDAASAPRSRGYITAEGLDFWA